MSPLPPEIRHRLRGYGIDYPGSAVVQDNENHLPRDPHRQLNCGACTLERNFPVRRRNFPVTRLEFPCFALQGISP
jgi:hypothetical protein